MGKTPENIHPFHAFLGRASKEQLLGQQAKVFWFTGLSGSGKTTIAKVDWSKDLQAGGFFGDGVGRR